MKTYKEVYELIEKVGYEVRGCANCPSIIKVMIPCSILFNVWDLADKSEIQIRKIFYNNIFEIVGEIE